MPTDLSSKIRDGAYRGLQVPWELDASSVWVAESSYDEQGLRVGAAVPQDINYDARWETSNTIGQDTNLWIRGLVGGYAGPERARFVWQEQTSGVATAPTGLWSGWDVPNTITGDPEVIEYRTAPPRRDNPYTMTALNDDVVLVYETTDSGDRVVYRKIRDASTGVWGSALEIHRETDTGAAYKAAPCTCLVPDGRILLFLGKHDTITNVSQVDVHYSTDNGATFTLGAANVLRTNIDRSTETLNRLRARQKDGQVLLVSWTTLSAGTDREGLQQYASDDGGNSFTLVDTFDRTTVGDGIGGYHDVVVAGGRFVIGYIPGAGSGTGTLQPSFYQLGSAYTPMTSTTRTSIPLVEQPGVIAGGVFTDGDFAVVRDEDDILYAYFIGNALPSDPGVMARSLDYGETWEGVGSGPAAGGFGTWYDHGQTAGVAGRPIRICACAQRARVVMVHGVVNSGGSGDEGLWSTYLGGYATVTMPSIDLFQQGSRQAGFDFVWAPFDLVSVYTTVWNEVIVGGVTTALVTTGAQRTTVPVGASYYVDDTGVTGQAIANEPIFAKCVGKINSGVGSWSLYLRHTDDGGGTFSYEVEARVTSAGVVEFHDAVSAALIQSINGVPTSGYIELLVAINGTDPAGYATCYYRVSDGDEDRQYTLVGTSSTLADGGATANPDRGRWGINTVGGTVALVVDFRRTQLNIEGTYAGRPGQLDDEQVNPDQLFGRSASSLALYVDDGVRIAARGGPFYRAQQWRITPEADYPVQNALVTVDPSPQRPWRSAGDASTPLVEPQRLAYQLNANGQDNAYSDVEAYYIDLTAREGLVEEYVGGAWQTVVDFDCRFACNYVRKGNVIVPDLTGGVSATTDGPYLAPDDLAGAVFEFAGGVTRPVRHNSEGIWIEGNSTAQLVPRLELDPAYMDGTEPTSGAGYWWWPRMLLIYRRTTWGEREGIRLSLHDTSPGISPPDEFLEVRNFSPGDVVIWGWQSSYGRAIEHSANVDTYRIGDGRTYTRKRGPVGRIVEHVFGDPAKLREFMGEDAVADYVLARDDGRPAAFRRSTPLQLAGLVRRLDGVNVPVVYCPYVPRTATGVSTSTLAAQRARGAFPARLQGPVRIEGVRGTEEIDERVQVGRITLREQV